MTKTEWLEILDPIVEECSQKLMVGVLKKNVIRYLKNKGITGEAATNILDMSLIRAENYMHYKAK